MSEQLWQYTAINGHPEDMQRNVRASDGSIIGEWAPVEPVGEVKVYSDTEWVNRWSPPRPSVPEGRYLLVPVEADDE